MMKKNMLFIILSMIIMKPITAQEMGKVLFNIYPPTAIVKIDSKAFPLKKEVNLAEGSYLIEIWAPRMAIFRDSITITKDSLIRYDKALSQLSNHYENYRKLKRKYLINQAVDYSADILVIGTNLIGTYYVATKSSKLADSKKRALIAKETYEERVISTAEAIEAKSEYEMQLNNYETAKKNHNTKIAVGIPVLALSYGISTYYFLKRRKSKAERRSKKPTYQEKKPFFSSLMDLEPNIGYRNNEFEFSISLKF